MDCATPRKLLLVEDEALIAMAETALLKAGGYEVVHAFCGEKAVSLVQEDPSFDLILMDIDLGAGLSGPEAAQSILGIRRLPIVFLTSHAEREMVEKVRNITRYGYVIKNSGKFVLLSSIEMAFELFESHQRTAESERRLSITLQSIGDAVISTDTRGNVERMNPAAESLTGWPADEALGRPLPEVFRICDALTRRPSADPVAEVLRSGEVIGLSTHTVLLSRSKKEYHIADSAAPIRDQTGAVSGVILCFSDVSSAYIAQEALRRSEQRFKSWVANSPAIVTVTDVEGRIKYLNRSDLGYDVADFIGTCLFDNIPDDQREVVRGAFHRAATTGEPQSYLTCFFADGTPFWYENRVASLDDDDLIIFSVNVTERKRAEAALAASARQREVILESISDAFFSLDTELRVTYFNAAAERMLKRSPSEVIGRPLFDAFPEARGSVFEHNYRHCLATKEKMAFEVEFPVPPYAAWYDVHVYPSDDGISVFFHSWPGVRDED